MTKDSDNTQIVKLTPEGKKVMALAKVDARFEQRYRSKLKAYSETVPTVEDFEKILDTIDADDSSEGRADSLAEVLNQTQGDKVGMFAQDERSVFPELRIFHGAGTDVNRPNNCQVGNFYLNTKEIVGEEFIGTVIAIWKGRTMWGNREAGESTAAPMCQSMDRIVGSLCGECGVCPDKPWRDGKKTRCNDDVVAFMLTRDYKRLIFIRFQKTSTKAGNQLYRNISIGAAPWTKWWRLTLDKQKNEFGQWYNIESNPAGDTDEELYTPKDIDAFCRALSLSLSAVYVLPGIAQLYKQSAAAANPDQKSGESPQGGGDAPSASPDDLGDNEDDEGKYGTMDDDGTEDKSDAPNV